MFIRKCLVHRERKRVCFYRWFVQPTHLCVAHSELHNVLEVLDEVSEGGEVIGIEGSHSLGKKLLSSLAEQALMLRYRLPDGRSWKRLWEGWVGSFTILVALLEHRARKMSRMEGRGAPMIFAAVFTVLCRVLRSAALQFPYQSVMQLLSTLSVVPL